MTFASTSFMIRSKPRRNGSSWPVRVIWPSAKMHAISPLLMVSVASRSERIMSRGRSWEEIGIARITLAIGLINRVFPDADFDESVDAYLEGLVEKSRSALTLMKSLLYQTDGMTLEKAIEAGVQMNALSRTTQDAKNGFAAFLKK